ncbi:MAG TPA: trypsin-like peptidase domain-containing protein [Chloroflexota bacterium]|jgi:S1-C subfamily serine protease|nr:trypsin-like peptidase domain-containing protein [Chloroflexota bacterium]
MEPTKRNSQVPARLVSIVAATAMLALGVGVVIGQTAGPQLAPSTAQAQAPVPLAAPASSVAAVAQSVGPAVVSVRTNVGLGSGVIYDSNGYILTNDHVVDGAQSITIGLVDGRHFNGRVVGGDGGFDVAVIKIDGSNLPMAPLGSSSSLQVGQDVVAIGNPFGFDHTLTTGVVSGLNRPVSEGQGSYNQPMIQTDAAINPGNSGGPLLDLNGQVIGITTLVAAPMGFPAQGLGFAVPVDTAKRIADQLVQQGKVTSSGQPYLGVSLSDINRPDAVPGMPNQPFPGFPGFGNGRRGGGATPRPTIPSGVDHGALVSDVSNGGAAAQAGIQAGDVIVNFDGFDIYNPDELLQRLVVHTPGDQVNATLVRSGHNMNVTIRIGEAPVQG